LRQAIQIEGKEGREGFALSRKQKQAMVDATEILKPFGVDVVEAAKFYASRNVATMRTPLREAVASYIQAKTDLGKSFDHARDLRHRLNRLCGDFENWTVGDLTTPVCQDWLAGLKRKDGKTPLEEQGKINFKTVCHGFFEWAKKRGMVVENPFEKVEAPRVRERTVSVFTPLEMEKLLHSALKTDKELIPFLVLAGFCGLRSGEVNSLLWEDYSKEDQTLVVKGDGTGGVRTRHLKLSAQALSWLCSFIQESGAVSPVGKWLYKRLEALSQASGVEWKSNALRHSFASYRLAQNVAPAQVSQELGNSTGVLNSHYKNRRCKPSDAEKWFSILPTAKGAKNLVFKTA